MKICGIIAEYNPFHLGHLYHLRTARNQTGADAVIIVMSGNLVQRGEPAIVDKYSRAAWAIKAGADLVLELPCAYACHGAQLFARGAINLLDRLGVVDHFAFGSEVTDLKLLTLIADLLVQEPQELSELIRQNLDTGASFPRARADAAVAYLGQDIMTSKALTQANSVLGLEYLQALRYLSSHMEPIIIPRQGDGYRQEKMESPLVSATAIRAALGRGEAPKGVSEDVAASLAHLPLCFLDDLTLPARLILTQMPAETLAKLPDMGEGLHLRLIRAAQEETSFSAIVHAALTRRYSTPRIQRAILHALLHMTQDDTDMLRKKTPVNAQVLAMGDQGPSLLSLIAQKSMIPLITRPVRYTPEEADQRRLWEISCRGNDLYSLLRRQSLGEDAIHRLQIL